MSQFSWKSGQQLKVYSNMTKFQSTTVLVLLIILIIVDGLNCEMKLKKIKNLKNVIERAKFELKALETDQMQSIWYSKLISTTDTALNLMQRLFDIRSQCMSILPSAQDMKSAGVNEFVDEILYNISRMIKSLSPMFEKLLLQHLWDDLRSDYSHKLEPFRIKFFVCQYERLQGLIQPNTIEIIENYIDKLENDLTSGTLITKDVEQQLDSFKSTINLVFDDFCEKSRNLATVIKTIWRILLDHMDESRKFLQLSQKSHKLTSAATKVVSFLNEEKNYINHEWKTNNRTLIAIRDETIFTMDAFISMLQFNFCQLVRKRGKSSAPEEAFTQIELDSIQTDVKSLLFAANNNQAAEAQVQLCQLNGLFNEKYFKIMETEEEYEVVLGLLQSFKLSPQQRCDSRK